MDEFTRPENKMRFCPLCRVAIMTLTTEAKQEDGSWKPVRIVRNCGHVLESDPN